MSGLLRDRYDKIWVSLEFPRKKTDRKKANCALRGYWTALKPEEQCAEDTQEKTVQVKMIKPAPGVVIIS